METDPVPLSLEVVSTVHRVDRSRWEALRDVRVLLTDLDYLAAIEQAQVLDCQYRYFMISHGQELLCSMAGYILDTDIATLSRGGNSRAAQAIRKVFPRFLKIRTLEIGSPITLGLTISRRPDLSQEQLAAIVNEIKGYARQNHVDLVLIRDFSDPEDSLEKALLQLGFAMIQSVPSASLPVVWKTFDEYVSDLRYKYRNNLKRSLRRKEECRIQTVIANDGRVLEHIQELSRLSANVVDRSKELPREHIGPAYHQAMYNRWRESSRWLMYFQDERLVAYIHFIEYHGSLTAQYIGMDYEVSRQAQLYFNIGYDLIRYSIEHGIALIHGGATSYAAKSAAGYSIYPQRVYILHENPLFQWVARRLPQPLQGQTSSCHYVFRDDKYQRIWRPKSGSHA